MISVSLAKRGFSRIKLFGLLYQHEVGFLGNGCNSYSFPMKTTKSRYKGDVMKASFHRSNRSALWIIIVRRKKYTLYQDVWYTKQL